MNPAHLHRLADAATRRAADHALPSFARRHWAHMASGWLRRAKIQVLIAGPQDEILEPVNLDTYYYKVMYEWIMP